jgi:hypothetical protein
MSTEPHQLRGEITAAIAAIAANETALRSHDAERVTILIEAAISRISAPQACDVTFDPAREAVPQIVAIVQSTHAQVTQRCIRVFLDSIFQIVAAERIAAGLRAKAAVTVESPVTVNMPPPRRTEKTLVHDAQGRPAKIIEQEVEVQACQ